MADKKEQFNPKKVYTKEALTAISFIEGTFDIDSGINVPRDNTQMMWFAKPSTIGVPRSTGTEYHHAQQDFLSIFSKFNPLDTEALNDLTAYTTYVKLKQKQMLPHENRLHWLTGLMSDLREFETALINFDSDGKEEDRVNLYEELGDILFFGISYAFEYNVHFSFISTIIRAYGTHCCSAGEIYGSINDAFRNFADLCDIEKGRMVSNKPFNVLDVTGNLAILSDIVVQTLGYLSSKKGKDTMKVVIDANKWKLEGRHGSGALTSESDIDRDVDKEAADIGKVI